MWCRLKSGWLIPSEGAHAIEVLGLEAAARRRGTKCRSLQPWGRTLLNQIEIECFCEGKDGGGGLSDGHMDTSLVKRRAER